MDSTQDSDLAPILEDFSLKNLSEINPPLNGSKLAERKLPLMSQAPLRFMPSLIQLSKISLATRFPIPTGVLSVS